MSKYEAIASTDARMYEVKMDLRTSLRDGTFSGPDNEALSNQLAEAVVYLMLDIHDKLEELGRPQILVERGSR